MNTGPDHPLDEDEAALARRLRALPGGTPSPELDARIRAQAHAAVAGAHPRVRPWLWGVSTAAVAVLAVGMFWQLGLPPDRLQDATRPTQQATEPPAPVQERAAERFEESAVGDTTPRKATEAAAPPPAAMAPAESRARAPAAERAAEPVLLDEPAPAVILAPPPPPPPAQPAPPPLPGVMPQRPAPGISTEADLARDPVLHEPEPGAAEAKAPAGAARRAGIAGAAAPAVDPARADAIQAYADGPAADWLAHIEALHRDGRSDDARAHLRAFRDAHPRHRLPDALQDLLDEGR